MSMDADSVQMRGGRGELLGTPGARVVKIRPPLAFSEAEIEPLAKAIERALGVH
jgi:4-aminobutyrate aminotransferase-like enzyme